MGRPRIYTDEERKEHKRLAFKKWFEANLDKEKARKKKWFEANLDKEKARKKKWREANPDQNLKRVIRSKTGISAKNITPELIESQRLLRLFKRWRSNKATAEEEKILMAFLNNIIK